MHRFSLPFFMRLTAVFSLLIAELASAQVSVYLNRYAINQNETVLLTVEVDQRSAQRPDFSPLNRDFHFLGSRQMSVSSHTNGENTYSSRWQILLRPRTSGELQIPSLNINGETSSPISVTVLATQRTPQIQRPEAFLEHNIDNNEVYVNSQLLYSVKLFHQQELGPLAHLEELRIDNAEVKPLGEARRYQTQLSGDDFQVLEQNYAIFPLQPGSLIIPGASFRSGPGAEAITESPLDIAVLNQAPQDPPGFWLPSTDVSITETWQMPEPLVPGAPITRRITLTADGIPASNLPSLMPLRNELARIAIDSVELDEQITSSGITGSRTETVTIIATERGEVTLPGITIPWWNIQRDRGEKATLPSAILRVQPGAAPISLGDISLPEAPVVTQSTITETATQSAAITTEKTQPATPAMTMQPDESPDTAMQAETDSNRMTKAAEPAAADNQTAIPLTTPQDSMPDDSGTPFIVWLLAGFSILCALGWLYTFATLRKLKQDPFAPSMPAAEAEMPSEEVIEEELDATDLMAIQLAEEDAFNSAIQACEQGMPLEARLLMLEWARYMWPDQEIQNSMDMIQASGSKTLELLLIDLENQISDPQSEPWAGDLLAQALQRIRDRQSALLQTL